MHFSSDSRYLVRGQTGHMVEIWDWQNDRLMEWYDGLLGIQGPLDLYNKDKRHFTYEDMCVVFSPDDRYLLVSEDKGGITIIDLWNFLCHFDW